jgi:hypothetical protein
MKVDKQTIPIYISVALSLITFFTIWEFGGVALPIIQILLGVVFVLWILMFLLVLSVPKLREKVSPSAITSAFIIYLGALFLSLSRFKSEIAEVDIDISMVGVGVALLAIGAGFEAQRKERKSETENSVENSTPEVSDETKETMMEQEPPSIDIVLDEVRRKLDFQFEQLDGLDTKSGIVLGIAGVIFTLLVTTLLEKHDTVVNFLLIKVALAPILISLILSFVTVSIRKYDRPPKLERLRNYYISEDAKKTKRSIIDISLAAIQKNEELIKKRVCLVKWSYTILAVGLGVLVVWVCLILWQ